MRRKNIKSKLVTNTPEKMELERVQQEKEEKKSNQTKLVK